MHIFLSFLLSLSVAFTTTAQASSLALADVQFEIGALTELGLEEGSFEHAFLHGLTGCVAAEAQGASCAAGAAGAVAQSLYAGSLDGDIGSATTANMYGACLAPSFSTSDLGFL